MRKVLIPVAVIALAIAAAAIGGRSESGGGGDAAAAPRRTSTSSRTGSSRSAPTTRPSRRGSPAARRRARPGRSTTPPRARASSRRSPTRSRKQLGFAKSQVVLGLHAVQQGVRAGQEVVRLRHQPDLVHARAREGRRLQRLVLRRQPVDRRPQGDADRVGALGRRPEEVQARRAARHDELRLHRQQHQAVRQAEVYDTNDAAVARSRTARSTGSSSTCRPRSTSPRCRSRTARSSASSRRTARPGALRDGLPEGQPARRLRQQGARRTEGGRHAEADPDRPGSQVTGARSSSRREPELADPRRRGGAGRAVTARARSRRSSSSPRSCFGRHHAPGWHEVKEAFFNWDEFRELVPGDRATPSC